MAAKREAGHEHIHTHGHDHTHAHDHGHDHTHDHDHVHPHDHEHAQDKWHAHTHDAAHPHTHGGVNDYMQAISAYRKTFPSRQQVLEQTPDPAVREARDSVEGRIRHFMSLDGTHSVDYYHKKLGSIMWEKC